MQLGIIKETYYSFWSEKALHELQTSTRIKSLSSCNICIQHHHQCSISTCSSLLLQIGLTNQTSATHILPASTSRLAYAIHPKKKYRNRVGWKMHPTDFHDTSAGQFGVNSDGEELTYQHRAFFGQDKKKYETAKSICKISSHGPIQEQPNRGHWGLRTTGQYYSFWGLSWKAETLASGILRFFNDQSSPRYMRSSSTADREKLTWRTARTVLKPRGFLVKRIPWGDAQTTTRWCRWVVEKGRSAASRLLHISVSQGSRWSLLSMPTSISRLSLSIIVSTRRLL